MGASPLLTDWIAFFVGLGVLAMAAGEWRHPGGWLAMLEEIEHSAALRFSSGLGATAIGAAITLASPLRFDDWLSVLVSLTGAVALVEGLMMLAAGPPFLAFAQRMMRHPHVPYAGGAAAIGAGLMFAGISRVHGAG